MISEAYCVDSGAPVRYEAGDRCIKHGAAPTPCFAALRDPRCEHPRRNANGSGRCDECGSGVPR